MNRRRIYLPVVLMLLAIIAVAAFQTYWLVKTFGERKQEFTFRANVLFRETVQRIRAEKLKIDTGFNKNIQVTGARYDATAMLDAMRARMLDSTSPPLKKNIKVTVSRSNSIYRNNEGKLVDSINEIHIFKEGPGAGIVRVLNRIDSLQDSISIKEITDRYLKALQKQQLPAKFSISSSVYVAKPGSQQNPPVAKENEVTIGFDRQTTYRLAQQDVNSYVLKKMGTPILISLLVVGITAFSLIVLLRSLVQQQKLTQLKNDFISNITHELKTPIATVSVAIEALRNFDALHNPARTKEYLAISSNELQRLSFLVDKVLKLSLFEKHQVELKEETVDMAALVQEVVTSMKLQFDKYNAQVDVQLLGDAFIITADRLHITSVLFNLLDNALKYSSAQPAIEVLLKAAPSELLLRVTDNGIGIAHEYHKKIFDKFFRVPAGDLHNVKGYGLGLSYVAYVVQQHNGSIVVESQPGAGSRFIITLPAAT